MVPNSLLTNIMLLLCEGFPSVFSILLTLLLTLLFASDVAIKYHTFARWIISWAPTGSDLTRHLAHFVNTLRNAAFWGLGATLMRDGSFLLVALLGVFLYYEELLILRVRLGMKCWVRLAVLPEPTLTLIQCVCDDALHECRARRKAAQSTY
jgi:hypothetical protein